MTRSRTQQRHGGVAGLECRARPRQCVLGPREDVGLDGQGHRRIRMPELPTDEHHVEAPPRSAARRSRGAGCGGTADRRRALPRAARPAGTPPPPCFSRARAPHRCRTRTRPVPCARRRASGSATAAPPPEPVRSAAARPWSRAWRAPESRTQQPPGRAPHGVFGAAEEARKRALTAGLHSRPAASVRVPADDRYLDRSSRTVRPRTASGSTWRASGWGSVLARMTGS